MATSPFTTLPISTVLATKALLGLGNVDNTSDLAKPVSTAVAALLATYRLSATQINPSEIAQDGATSGQVLKWNGTAWAPGTDIVGSGGGGGGDVATVFGRIGDVVAQSNDYTFAQIGSKPTTLTGYGITDAAPSSHVGSGGTAHSNATGGAAGFMSATDFTKLQGIAPNATANLADATLLDRSNHTGLQPISTVTSLQAALDAKAPINNPTFTGTVAGVTAAMVGLGAVNNTADSAKPVSTAQATAIALRHVNIQFQEEGSNLGAAGTADVFNVVGGGTLSRVSNTLTLTIPAITDATGSANGVVRLTGALGGTAAAPTALGLADASALTTLLNGKADALASAAALTTGTNLVRATHGNRNIPCTVAATHVVTDDTTGGWQADDFMRGVNSSGGNVVLAPDSTGTTTTVTAEPGYTLTVPAGASWYLQRTAANTWVGGAIKAIVAADITDSTTPGRALLTAADAAAQRTALTAAARAQTFGFGAAFADGADETIVLDQYATFAYTIDSSVTQCTSGTATYRLQINGTNVGSTANSVSSTEQSQAHSSANAVAIGDTVALVRSANATCVMGRIKVNCTRTLA